MREFLHVDGMAQAVVFVLENRMSDNLYNVGTGVDVTIKGLAKTIQEIVGHNSKIVWDSSKPDTTPRKLMNTGKAQFSWLESLHKII